MAKQFGHYLHLNAVNVSTLEMDLERERGRVRDLEKQVGEIRRNISARDALIRTLETCNSEKEELILQLKVRATMCSNLLMVL